MMSNVDLDHAIIVLIIIVWICGLLTVFTISWALVSRLLAVVAVMLPIGVVLWLGYPSYRHEITLDLSRPQDLSGIPPEHLNWMSSGDIYLFRRIHARLTLPDGTRVEKDMSSVAIKLEKNRLTEVRFTSFGMPVRQIVTEAHPFLQLMREDHSHRQSIDDRVTAWSNTTIDSGVQAKDKDIKATVPGLELAISVYPAPDRQDRGNFLYQIAFIPRAP